MFEQLTETIDTAIMQPRHQLSDAIAPLFTPLTEFLYQPEMKVRELTTMTPVQINIFFAMNMCFIFSLCLSTIRCPTSRKLFSTTFGLFLGFYNLGLANWRAVLSVVCVYGCMKLFPKDR